MNNKAQRSLDGFDEKKRLQRFYAILLDADLACFSDLIEKRRRYKK
ncbi:MAG: hypothetical protein WCI77_01125 [Candidatus Omnitrophota bacterium]